jgi:hypothetical protein
VSSYPSPGLQTRRCRDPRSHSPQLLERRPWRGAAGTAARGSLLAALSCGALGACSTEHIELGPRTHDALLRSEGAAANGVAEAPHSASDEAGAGEPQSSDPLVPPVALRGLSASPGLAENPVLNFLPGTSIWTETGCTKADFLFVVDNSRSMRDEQLSLSRSFPGFMQVIQGTLNVGDLHIMIVDTDGKDLEEVRARLDPGEADPCETVLGAGRRDQPDGQSCSFATGSGFLDEGQPHLPETFACVAEVGTDGSPIERPAEAVLAAVSAPLNASDGCNGGFLREDAILVVTIITDEEDRHSSGDPADWKQALVAAKGGNEDAVVVLGLLGDNNLEDGLCRGLDADGAPRLQEFANGLGLVGSVCEPDYNSFFERAVGRVAKSCASLVLR